MAAKLQGKNAAAPPSYGGAPSGAAGIGAAARGIFDRMRPQQSAAAGAAPPAASAGAAPAAPPAPVAGGDPASQAPVSTPTSPAAQSNNAAAQQMQAKMQMLQQNPMSGLGMAAQRIAALRNK